MTDINSDESADNNSSAYADAGIDMGTSVSTSTNAVSRRALCIGTGAAIALSSFGALRYIGSQSLVRPPGGQDEENLVSKCIHCYRCVEVCPQKIIVPASIEAGVFNFRTPCMNFSDCYPGQLDSFRYCDFCMQENGGIPLCVKVCPSTALSLSANYSSNTEVIGKAAINTNTCIAYRSSFCAYCHDACAQVRGEDNAAIYYENADADNSASTRLPVVDASKCNGCGACEAVCVSAQAGSTLNANERAIVVNPLES